MGIFEKIRQNREELQELLHENEVQANKTIAVFIIALIIGTYITIIFAIITYGESFLSVPYLTTFLSSIVGVIIIVVMWRQKFEASWIKHWLLGYLTISLMFSIALTPGYSLYLLPVPLLISIRYFDKELSIRVGLCSLILFAIGSGANMWLHVISPEVAAYQAWLETGWWEKFEDMFTSWFLPPTMTFIFLIWYAGSIAKCSAMLIKNFEEKSREKNAVDAELGMASQIQMNSLPPAMFTTPRGHFSLAAKELTAREVGGDFYDYYMLDENRLVVVIADVSDKGVPAALFMMSAKKTLRCALECSETLENAVAMATRLLCEDNKSDMFLTLWVAVIDVRTGWGRYVNAGHPLPYLKHRDGTIDTIDNDPDLFIGNFPDMPPCAHLFHMVPGDMLLIYTDGVADAESTDATRFGDKGIINTMKEAGPGASVVVDAVMADAQHYAEGMVQFDDMTILALECLQIDESKSATLCLPADENSIEDCIDATEELVSVFDCPDSARRRINTVIDEVMVNIVSYAYEDLEEPEVQPAEGKLGYGRMFYSVEAGGNYVLLTFEDCGVAFDPLAKEDPDLDDTFRIGGLGIYLCKNLSDDIYYERVDDKNVLRARLLWGA